jgi:hypothetical protein
MFSSAGGGGFPLPRMDNPAEIVIVLVVLAILIWLGFRAFSD